VRANDNDQNQGLHRQSMVLYFWIARILKCIFARSPLLFFRTRLTILRALKHKLFFHLNN